MAKIKAPNREYNGRVGNVQFVNGVAETDDQAVIQYCQGAGYQVDGTTDNPAPRMPEPADPRTVRDETGAPLRDAAVDPKPGDFLPPTNAGEANPHGPEVVSPGVHAAPPAPIVPGPVPADPDRQQARETEAANRTLVDNEPVPAVTADMGDPAQPVDQERVEPPAGNASAEEWRTYAVEHRGASPETVAGMKRDELRDQYGPRPE